MPSVQPTGRIGRLSVGGSLSTYGDDVVTLDVEGAIDTLKVQQGITAAGVVSDAVRLTGEVAGLDEVTGDRGPRAAHPGRYRTRLGVSGVSGSAAGPPAPAAIPPRPAI